MERRTGLLLSERGTVPDNECSPLLTEMPRRLSLSTRIAYGMGHILNDICAAVWFSYTMLFLQVVLGMAPLLAGSMLLIGQVVDALATPIIGILADRIATKRAWHMAGSILVVSSFPLVFRTCASCRLALLTGSSQIVPVALTYALLVATFQVGWAAVQISHLAMIPELSADQKGRNELTAIRYTASVCASVAVYVITWVELRVTAKVGTESLGPGDDYKFKNIVLIGLALGILTTIWFHVGLRKHRSTVHLGIASSTNPASISIGSYFRTPLLFQVALLYVASRLFVTLTLIYMPLYLQEGLKSYPTSTDSLALVPLVSYIASFISSLVAARLIRGPSGNEVAYFFGSLASLLGCFWIGYNKRPDFLRSEIYGVAILIGAGSSVTMVSSLCLTAEFIGSRTGNGGFVYSVVTFADKLLNGLAVILIEKNKYRDMFDYLFYYRDVLAYVCSGTVIVGLLTLGTLMANHLPRRTTELKPSDPI